MAQMFLKSLVVSTLVLGLAIPSARAQEQQPEPVEIHAEDPNPSQTVETPQILDLIEALETYESVQPNSSQNSGRIKFSDVRPSDWAFQALDALSQRYDCLNSYPETIFSEARILTRYEFAVVLNTCVQQLENSLQSAPEAEAVVSTGDLQTIQFLTQEFDAELAVLDSQLEGLYDRVLFLEDVCFCQTPTSSQPHP